ncbi:NADH dehydrogenase [ubiquinone] 1 alpha subcomplex subunit 5-like [Tubulanus polymorphus]|uniref:NADH dehydrogenase [ubiquinone] 1 alpha subcomplex subunit 5-like n=1 Tax=Tubulanus polymorphus TaxID=672921 RepID=UPI003DA536B9
MAAVLKTTTGLTGLAVAKNPQNTLRILYDKILRTLDKMPKDAGYRKRTQIVVNERLQAVKSEPTVEKLEKKLNAGQIEEVILQAERELLLSRKMLEWKAWEPLQTHPPANQWKWPM